MTMNDMLLTAMQAPVGGRFQPQGNANGQVDLSLSGKSGFYQLMMQKTMPTLTPEQLLLLPEDATEGDALLQELAAALMMPVSVDLQNAQPTQNTQPLPEAQAMPVSVESVPVTTVQPAVQQNAQQTAAPVVSQQAQTMQPVQPVQQQAGSQTTNNTSRADVLPTQNATVQDAVVQTAATQTDQDAPDLLNNSEAQAKPLFQNVDHTPIKVGDPAPLDSEAPDFNAQLGREINKAMQNGEQKITLQLAPANLGKVVVEISRSQDGSMQLLLHASTDTAANLLRSHSAELSSLLRSNTQAPVYVEVQQPQQSSYTQQEQQQQQQQQQHQQHQQQKQNSDDFLEQLRLGLVPLAFEAS